jgi:hypothetical protein
MASATFTTRPGIKERPDACLLPGERRMLA